MHLTLTDRLTCPRCGPAAGLIVLMDEVEHRRVVTGTLGCPQCRERYPIAGRVADLRAAAGTENGRPGARARAGAGAGSTEERAVRVAALLGLTAGSGFVLVDGPDALPMAGELGKVAPDFEPVVAIDDAHAGAAGGREVSAFLDSGALPMADSLMRGAAYVGGVPEEARLRELVRVVRPTDRVVIEAQGGDLDEAARLLVELGAEVRARDGTALVAVVL